MNKFYILAITAFISACATNSSSKQDINAIKVIGRVTSVFDSNAGKQKPDNIAPTPTGNTAADAATTVFVYGGNSNIKRCEYTIKTNDDKTIVVKHIIWHDKQCPQVTNDCITAWISPSQSYQTIEMGGICTK